MRTEKIQLEDHRLCGSAGPTVVCFPDNNDTMFDAVKFGVGIVAPEGYTALEEEEQNYSYSWKYEEEPSDELREKEMAEDLMDIIRMR